MKIYTGFEITGCLVSEKYDGISALWNGETLKTRNGNILHAPNWFVSGLPKVELHGELWYGRGQFEMCMSICRSHDSGDKWREITFMIFRGPTDTPIGDHAKYVEWWPAVDVNSDLDHIVSNGGEGVVIRDREGIDYKHKPVEDDDAVVIGHAEGKGRNAGRCGALLVRDRSGLEFRIGTGLSDSDRDNPPCIGKVIEFSFQGRTRTKKPRFASFVRTRAEEDFV
jgi:DNA ligase 1